MREEGRYFFLPWFLLPTGMSWGWLVQALATEGAVTLG